MIYVPMGEEKLVEAVRCYPCLWQVSSKSYRDLIAKKCMEGSGAQISELVFRICHTHFLKKLVVLSLLLACSKYTTNPHTSATLPSPSLLQIQCQHENDLQLLFTIQRIICTLTRIHVRRVWSMYAVHTLVHQRSYTRSYVHV